MPDAPLLLILRVLQVLNIPKKFAGAGSLQPIQRNDRILLMPMNLFKQSRPTTNPEAIQQIKAWTQQILDLPVDVPISISQLQCHEPGCPPIETVIAVMTQPTQTFKIHAAARGDNPRTSWTGD
jgi:hypothetical protein